MKLIGGPRNGHELACTDGRFVLIQAPISHWGDPRGICRYEIDWNVPEGHEPIAARFVGMEPPLPDDPDEEC